MVFSYVYTLFYFLVAGHGYWHVLYRISLDSLLPEIDDMLYVVS